MHYFFLITAILSSHTLFDLLRSFCSLFGSSTETNRLVRFQSPTELFPFSDIHLSSAVSLVKPVAQYLQQQLVVLAAAAVVALPICIIHYFLFYLVHL